MAKFQFKDRSLILDIGGATFTLNPSNSDFLKLFHETSLDCQKKAQELQSRKGDMATPDEINTLCEYIKKAIDSVLGTGAVEKIFLNRDITFFDLLDVMQFAWGEVSEYIPNNVQEYTSPKNRSQRRKG